MKKILAVLATAIVLTSAQHAAAAMAGTFTTTGAGVMEVTTGGNGALQLTITPGTQNFASLPGTDLYWSRFFLNLAPGRLNAGNITVDAPAGSWQVLSTERNLLGDYNFAILGTGVRQETLPQLRLTISDPNVSLADIVAPYENGMKFTGRATGLNPASLVAISSYLDDHKQNVPLPAAFWLLGSGLAGTMLARRRMNASAQTL
jgi:hypothetical protein